MTGISIVIVNNAVAVSQMNGDRVNLVRLQVEAILGSPEFKRAHRSSQLLRFLGDAAINQEHCAIKEYTIATQVFGRPESFDPRVDSLVRVEASRLRTRLQNYYELNKTDPIEIVLPPGSYILKLLHRDLDNTSTLEPNVFRFRHALFAGALIVLLAGVTFALLRAKQTPNPTLKLVQHLAVPGEVLLSPALSPDLRYLYHSSNRGESRLRIWRQSLQETNQSVAMTSPESTAYDIDVSPDGALLAYWSSRNGGGIHIQAATGGPEQVVAPLGLSARFSPDGKWIVYWVRQHDTGFGKIFVVPLTEPRERSPVAPEFDDAHNPQWMNDGRILLCGTLRSNVKAAEHDLWIVTPSRDQAPLKTGILPHLSTGGIDTHFGSLNFTSFQCQHQYLVFSGLRGVHAGLYSLALNPKTFQPKGEPQILHESVNSQYSVSLRGHQLAFAHTNANLGIWTIPLGSDGLSAAPPQRLTDDPGDEFGPSISRNGRQLMYLARRPPQMHLWTKDLNSGMETEIFRNPSVTRMRIAPDGSKVFLRLMVGNYPQKQAILAADLIRGGNRQVCRDCGGPTSISTSGDFVVYEPGTRLSAIAVLELATGQTSELIRHPHYSVRGGRISPDEKWIAFELDRGPDGGQIFQAPFRGLTPVAASEWKAITDPGVSSFLPDWSADGSSLYFLREREGTHDLCRQPLSTDRRTLGPPAVVYHFANPKLTPLTFHQRQRYYTGLSVASNQAVLTLSELNGSIWRGQLAP